MTLTRMTHFYTLNKLQSSKLKRQTYTPYTLLISTVEYISMKQGMSAICCIIYYN